MRYPAHCRNYCTSSSHGSRSFILHAPQTQATLQRLGDVPLHVGQLLLNQLVGCQRTTGPLSIQRLLARGIPVELRRAQRAPGRKGVVTTRNDYIFRTASRWPAIPGGTKPAFLRLQLQDPYFQSRNYRELHEKNYDHSVTYRPVVQRLFYFKNLDGLFVHLHNAAPSLRNYDLRRV